MFESPRYTKTVLRIPEDHFADDIRESLACKQKWVGSHYLYNAVGSDFFEQICDLPEYYPTRLETRILTNQASALLDSCPDNLEIVELGSGSSRKTRHLIEESLSRQEELHYHAIDISEDAIDLAAEQLVSHYGKLQFNGLIGDFADGLQYLSDHDGGPRLVLFLGSTIGNLTKEQVGDLLTLLRQHLRPGERFLIGFDLIKDLDILIPAYNDSQKVTAGFNKNVLARMNRDLDADFDLEAFEHRATFNSKRSRVEMHLVSKKAQVVRLRAIDMEVAFRKEETIHTENSYKFTLPSMTETLREHGFRTLNVHTDEKQWYCVLLVH